MKLLLPTIVGLAAVYPPMTEGWNCGPAYYGVDVWSPRVLQKQQQMAMWKQQQSRFQKAFIDSSPRYEISDTRGKFQVSVDVPGVKPDDLHVNYEADKSILSIRGSRARGSEDESSSYSSNFSLSFSVDPTVDAQKFTAKLQSGVLILTAPKNLKMIEENILKIPVVLASDDDEETKVDISNSETKVVVDEQESTYQEHEEIESDPKN